MFHAAREPVMKFALIILSAVFCSTPLLEAQISTWKADPVHSEVDFTVRHLGVANVHGRFGVVKATVRYNPADVSKSNVTATVGVNTVETGEQGRDGELKSVNFFDVNRYPTAMFSSTSVSKNGKGGLWVRGNLTLHGITKPVILNVQGPSKPVLGPDGKPHSGFSATTTIDRTAFDIGPNYPVAVVGDQVKLEIDLEIIKE